MSSRLHFHPSKPPNGIIFDFDGVFTDNKVYTNSDGIETIRCCKYDSLSLAMFRRKFPEFPLLVISSETNEAIVFRCHKLGLECISGATNKVEEAQRWAASKDLDLNDLVFIFNDLNDLKLAEAVGYSVAVKDASKEALSAAHFTTVKPGGDGAVREVLDTVADALQSPQFANKNGHEIDYERCGDLSLYDELNGFQEIGPRDWGKEILIGSVSKRFTIKHLIIKAGHKGGLQFHRRKHEFGYLLKGRIVIRHTKDGRTLEEKILNPGSFFEFRPFSIHQEEAIEDCEILEISTPFLNDRVRVEKAFGLDHEMHTGLPSTRHVDIQEI